MVTLSPHLRQFLTICPILGDNMEIDVEVDFDEDEFREAFAEHAKEQFKEWIEGNAGNGGIECDCGSRSFDVETWWGPNDEIKAAGVCVSCNERVEIDVDTSDLDNI